MSQVQQIFEKLGPWPVSPRSASRKLRKSRRLRAIHESRNGETVRHEYRLSSYVCLIKSWPEIFESFSQGGNWLANAGAHARRLSASGFKIAYIMGVHFRAGEWGRRPRCGSVITTTRVFLYPRFVSIIFNYSIMNYLTFLLLLVYRGVIRTMRASWDSWRSTGMIHPVLHQYVGFPNQHTPTIVPWLFVLGMTGLKSILSLEVSFR